jgi:hypothetical protein
VTGTVVEVVVVAEVVDVVVDGGCIVVVESAVDVVVPLVAGTTVDGGTAVEGIVAVTMLCVGDDDAAHAATAPITMTTATTPPLTILRTARRWRACAMT